MKNLLLIGAILLVCVGTTFAQTPPSNLSGSSLRSWLKSNFYDGKHKQLGYSEARRQMYNSIDNKNNSITGVYSGYQKSWQAGGTGTNPMPINAEHTVPQSFFDRSEPMRSDIHHLFPTFANWNSERSNHKFEEIPDSRTRKWMFLNNSQTRIPRSNINAYSESDGTVFEPREIQKGNTARAIFYFYTMYPSQAGSITSVGNINTLYQWHMKDPVDATERARNNAIARVQGDRNPYIDQPNLVARAWNLSGGGTPPTGTTSTLFISEYVEGSSNNKAIEIANQTGRTVDMTGYSLRKQTNGQGNWSSDYLLNGSLRNGGVYVIANSNASAAVTNRANRTTGTAVMTFNGNDPVGLFKDGRLVDIVGRYNGGSANFAKDRTLIRVAAVRTGNTSYRSGNWKAYVQDTFAALGNLNLGRKSESTSLQELTDSITSKTIRLYPNPCHGNAKIEVPSTVGDQLELRIYDTSGRMISSEKRVALGKEIFAINQLVSGVYFIRIIGDRMNTTSKLTVK